MTTQTSKAHRKIRKHDNSNIIILLYFSTEAKLCFAKTSDNTTKKQPYKVKQKQEKQASNFKTATYLIRPCDLEIWSTTPFWPRTLNNRQTLVTNKAATYANELPMRRSKSGTKWNKTQFCKKQFEVKHTEGIHINFACNKLESIKTHYV